LGDAFHLQQTLWFREPPTVTIAIVICQQPQDVCPYVAMSSHGTCIITLSGPWGKAYITLGYTVTEL